MYLIFSINSILFDRLFLANLGIAVSLQKKIISTIDFYTYSYVPCHGWYTTNDVDNTIMIECSSANIFVNGFHFREKIREKNNPQKIIDAFCARNNSNKTTKCYTQSVRLSGGLLSICLCKWAPYLPVRSMSNRPRGKTKVISVIVNPIGCSWPCGSSTEKTGSYRESLEVGSIPLGWEDRRACSQYWSLLLLLLLLWIWIVMN